MKEKEEQFFKDMIAKSDLKMPFCDFEDEVMMQIKKEQPHKKSLPLNHKLSWGFFVVGTIFGVVISLIIPNFTSSIAGISANNVSIVFQVFFVLFVMLQLESLLISTKSATEITAWDNFISK